MTLLLLFGQTEPPLVIERAGRADGTSNVDGRSGYIQASVGNANGVSSANAVTPHIVSGVGNANGYAVAYGNSDYVIGYVGEDFLPTALKLEFQKKSYILFTAITIYFPLYTMHCLDSSGIVRIGTEIYSGMDSELGSISSLDVVSDGVGDDAPAIRIVILPPTAIAASTLIHEGNQGATVAVSIGAVDQTTGQTIGVQEVFLGEVDTATLEVEQNLRQVTLECVSIFERFFDDDEGTRLTDSWHQAIWPGEQGLVYVTDIERQIPWGADAPLPPPVTAKPSTSTQYVTNFGWYQH